MWNGENVEVTQTFTYIGNVIHSSTSCELEVNRRLGRAWWTEAEGVRAAPAFASTPDLADLLFPGMSLEGAGPS